MEMWMVTWLECRSIPENDGSIHIAPTHGRRTCSGVVVPFGCTIDTVTERRLLYYFSCTTKATSLLLSCSLARLCTGPLVGFSSGMWKGYLQSSRKSIVITIIPLLVQWSLTQVNWIDYPKKVQNFPEIFLSILKYEFYLTFLPCFPNICTLYCLLK